MKNILLILLLLGLSHNALSFEPSSLNLRVPSALERNSIVLEVRHRFYGILTEDPLDNFFGLDFGGNVNLGVRYAVVDFLELHMSYTTLEKEYRIGASYAYRPFQIPVQGQVELQYFNFERNNVAEGNFYCCAALQTDPIVGIFTPVVNLGYDGFNERIGLGFGLEAGFDWQFGPVERVSVIGEYFPVVESEELITEDYNYFAFGLKVYTYGHHFMFQVSNGWNIGPRRLMLGTPTDDIYLGFNIHRLLRF
ncbi:MAG: hypothetical protein JSU64_01040 [candidate division WOR-3 bacterium]|nr:MAG: hypothetical protein JSU64_01040 [candidate division WOR-3 bacterium]